jgi:hypothetical protein
LPCQGDVISHQLKEVSEQHTVLSSQPGSNFFWPSYPRVSDRRANFCDPYRYPCTLIICAPPRSTHATLRVLDSAAPVLQSCTGSNARLENPRLRSCAGLVDFFPQLNQYTAMKWGWIFETAPADRAAGHLARFPSIPPDMA